MSGQHRHRVQGGWAIHSSTPSLKKNSGSTNRAHQGSAETFVFKDPKVHKMASKKPFNFSWFIDGVLAGSGLPSQSSHLQFFIDEGIKHLVSLTEWKPALHATPGLNHIHMAIAEFEPPSLKQVHDFVTLVEAARAKNQPVCVHCHWGLGRTGTMLACYLLKAENLTPQDAIRLVREKRRYSIETYDQENVVHEYAQFLNSESK